MADPHVLTGLIAKRAEIAGQIEHVQTSLRQLIIDLDNLNATIRIFRPDTDLEEIRPKPFPPRHAAFKGEIMRVVMGRPADLPKAAHGAVEKRVGACLRHHRSRRLVASHKMEGALLHWTLGKV